MRGAAHRFPVALALLGGITPVRGANDTAPQLRGCSLTTSPDRLECLDRASRPTALTVRLMLAGDDWVVSQTTSPVDYSPIATATTSSRKLADSPSMQLSIRCRGGRTEVVVTGPAIAGRGNGYLISYRVNGGQPVQLAGAASAFGDGVAFKGDVVTLLQSLPQNGELAVRLVPLSGAELNGIFPLDGLDMLRARIGATCQWPHAVARPDDR
jgi:hypothetical protein